MLDADRDKLVKILRLLSSDHDGEVAAAGRRAHSFLKTRGLDWDTVISAAPQRFYEEPPRQRRYEPPPPPPEPDELPLIRKARKLEQYVTAWEREFLASVEESLGKWPKLTEKQRAVLDRIIDKLKEKDVWDGDR